MLPLCFLYFLCIFFFLNPISGLGYHKDLQTRATFMEVLTKILQQGTEFDTLAETVLADRFERLVELVTMMGDQGELPIAMALANVVPCSQWVCTGGVTWGHSVDYIPLTAFPRVFYFLLI